MGPLFAALLLVSLLGALDHTIVASSLATVVGELGGVEQMAWMVTSYTLAMTVAMPVYGQLGDILGHRRLFLLALSVFILGSVACGFAGDMAQLTAARLFQGVGAAGTALLSQTILADVLPPRQRAKYQGFLGSVFAIATVVGPLVGGVLTDTVGWRWIFLINLPLGVVAFVMAALTIPRLAPGAAHARFDLAGAVLLVGAITGLVLVVTWGGSSYAWSSPVMVAVVATTLVAVAGFVVVERRVEHPIVPFGIFRNRVVVGGMVLSLVLGAGMFSIVSYLPAYVQMRYTTSATVAGLIPLAIVIGMMITSNVTGVLVSRTGRYRLYPILGTGVAAVAFAASAAVVGRISLPVLAVLMAFVGLGTGAFMQLIVVIVQNQARHSVMGVTTSTANLVRQVGATFGTALIGGYFGGSLVQRLAAVDLPGGVGPDALTPALMATASRAVRAEVAGAYADAIAPVLAALSVVFAVGFVAALVAPAPALRPTHHLPEPVVPALAAEPRPADPDERGPGRPAAGPTLPDSRRGDASGAAVVAPPGASPRPTR